MTGERPCLQARLNADGRREMAEQNPQALHQAKKRDQQNGRPKLPETCDCDQCSAWRAA